MGDILGGQLSTNENGRTTLTGAGSDINFGKQIDKIIEAKRQPAVRLEGRIQENQTKVDALNELQSRVVDLQDAADKLRGRTRFDDAGNVFEAKQAFVSATRSDNQQPSEANSILTANVENAAETQSSDIEVLETASRHKLASTSIADQTANLDGTSGNPDIGSDSDFTVNGVTINVSNSDSLVDIGEKINRANTGSNATGVTATVVQVAGSDFRLQLQSDDPGKTISLQDGANNPLDALGILDGAGNIEPSAALQDESPAIFRVDNLSDSSVFESSRASGDATNAISTIGFSNGDSIDIAITNDNNTTTQTIDVGTAAGDDVAESDSVQALADEISSRFGLQGRAVVGNGRVRLEVNAENTEDVQQSRQVSDPTANLSSLDGISSDSAELRFTTEGGKSGDDSRTTLTFDPTSTSLNQLANDISNNVTNVEARVDNNSLIVRSNNGTDSNGKLNITDVSGSLADDLNFGSTSNVPQLSVSGAGSGNLSEANAISRPSNTIDDLFNGTTINLEKAERGTTVQFDIERDLAATNEAIQEVVDAFNSVKRFINAQRQERALEDQDPEADNSIVGVLQGETILNDVQQDLNSIVQRGAENSGSELTFLGALGEQAGSLGISFVDNDSLSDPTKEDTLQINQQRLNDQLINNFNEVRKLFEFDFSSPNTGLTRLGSSENTGAADGTLTVPVDANGNVDESATGADLQVEVPQGSGESFDVRETSDNVLEVTEGPLQGLTLQADFAAPGSTETKNIDISTSRGIGFNAFHTAQGLGNSNPRDGVVESKIAELVGSDSPDIEGQNERFRDEIDRIERQLERERERLLQQFTAAEQALLELESAQQRLTQFAGGGSSNG